MSIHYCTILYECTYGTHSTYTVCTPYIVYTVHTVHTIHTIMHTVHTTYSTYSTHSTCNYAHNTYYIQYTHYIQYIRIVHTVHTIHSIQCTQYTQYIQYIQHTQCIMLSSHFTDVCIAVSFYLLCHLTQVHDVIEIVHFDDKLMRFIWLSESTGFHHLELVEAQLSMPPASMFNRFLYQAKVSRKPLTSGPWVVMPTEVSGLDKHVCTWSELYEE